MKRIRVLVANQPRLMRELIMATIADQPDIELAGEIGKQDDLADAVAQTRPDVLILAMDDRSHFKILPLDLLRGGLQINNILTE